MWVGTWPRGTSRFWQWINIEALLNPPSEPLQLIPHRFWWWWQSSRVLQDIDLLGVVSPLSPIDEFPAFSYVLGDLHPHVLVMPFVMLVINLAMNIYQGAMDEENPIHLFGLPIPFKWDLFFVSAILVGGIIFMNTWDLPVYFSLLVGAFLLRQVKVKGWAGERIGEALTLAVPLGVLSFILYLLPGQFPIPGGRHPAKRVLSNPRVVSLGDVRDLTGPDLPVLWSVFPSAQ